MERKNLIILTLILISAFFIYRTFVNRSELNAEKNINDVLIKEYNAKLDDKEAKLIKDSIIHFNRIDSLYNEIKTLNKSLINDRIKHKKELAKLKNIRFVGDFNAYNDSLFNFIRTNTGH